MCFFHLSSLNCTLLTMSFSHSNVSRGTYPVNRTIESFVVQYDLFISSKLGRACLKISSTLYKFTYTSRYIWYSTANSKPTLYDAFDLTRSEGHVNQTVHPPNISILILNLNAI